MDKKYNKTIINFNFYVNVKGRKNSTKLLAESSYSSLASCRLQQFPALRAAHDLGFQTEIFSLHSDCPEYLDEIGHPSICLVGKLSAPSEALVQSMALATLACATRLKRRGVPILIVYSDHHLIHPATSIRELHKDIFYLADGVVFTTESMRQLAAKSTKLPPKTYIIEDALQFQEPSPYITKTNEEEFKLLWFGQGANLKYLLEILPKLKKNIPTCGATLTILTSKQSLKKHQKFIHEHSNPSLTLKTIDWDNAKQPNQLKEEIINAHIVLLPSDKNDPFKIGVSHNRIIDSIQGGCIPIATPMESYKDLAKLAVLSEQIPEDLGKLFAQYNRLIDKYKLTREDYLSRFSAKANQEKWKRCLTHFLST